jgi:hypothetical protein
VGHGRFDPYDKRGVEMKLRKLLTYINVAWSNATLEHCAFDNIGGAGERLVTMADGSPVTENNVNDFIRERTDIYRHYWIILPLTQAITMVEGALPHARESRFESSLQICAHCDFGRMHRLHKVR